MARAGTRQRKPSHPIPPRELTEFPADPAAPVDDMETVRLWLDWFGARDKWAYDNDYDPDDWVIG